MLATNRWVTEPMVVGYWFFSDNCQVTNKTLRLLYWPHYHSIESNLIVNVSKDFPLIFVKSNTIFSNNTQ